MVEITVFAALLATALLYVCEGPGFDQTVRQLHAFILVFGEKGASILTQKLNEGIFDILSDAVRCLKDCPENHNLRFILTEYDLLKETWIEDVCSVAEPSIWDREVIHKSVECMAKAESEDELLKLLHEVNRRVLNQEGVLVEKSIGFAEDFLTQWIAKFLKDHPDELNLSMTAQRALDLYDLLSNSPVLNGDLFLISSYHGKFVPISPNGVNSLTGQDSGGFLYGELDRLADTLVVNDLFALLSQLLCLSTKENPVLNRWRHFFQSLGE